LSLEDRELQQKSLNKSSWILTTFWKIKLFYVNHIKLTKNWNVKHSH
jgi:hypothetical protein